MKKILTAAYAVLVIALFVACTEAGLEGPSIDEVDPLARAINLPGSTWTDGLNPSVTLSFTSDQVTLGGGKTGDNNWYWGSLDGQNLPINVVDTASAMTQIIDYVEPNWGSDVSLPDAVIIVWTNTEKKTGFQLYHYAPVPDSRYNYDRLVCWGVGQPHEFKRQ
jgi:hypothetical protein